MGDKTHTHTHIRLRCGGRVSLCIFQTYNSRHPHKTQTHQPFASNFPLSYRRKNCPVCLLIMKMKNTFESIKIVQNEEIFEFFNENLFDKRACVSLSFFSWLMIKKQSRVWGWKYGVVHTNYLWIREIFFVQINDKRKFKIFYDENKLVHKLKQFDAKRL